MAQQRSEEERAVLDDIGREMQLCQSRSEASLQFVRYIAENDLAPAIQALQDTFPDSTKALDLYRDEVEALKDPEVNTWLISHIDQKLAKLDTLLSEELSGGGGASYLVLVTPDDVKALVDHEYALWKRRNGFHSWPRARSAPNAGGATRGLHGGRTEPLTADGMREVVRLLEHEPENLDDVTKQRAFTMVLNLLRKKKLEDARRILMRFINALKMQGDIQSLATSYLLVGNITFEMNNYRNAIEWYNEAQSFIEKLDDDVKLSDLYHQRGYTLFLLGDYKTALDDFRRALTIDEALDDDFRKSLIYRRIGVALDLIGSSDDAISFFEQALVLEQRQQNDAGLARVYQHLGRLAEKKDDYEKAGTYYEQSLEIKERMNDNRGLASLYHQYGNLRFNREQYSEALELYRKSLVIEEKLADYQSLGRTLVQIGLTQDRMQHVNEAVATLQKASKLLTKLNSPLVGKVNELITEFSARKSEDLDGVFKADDFE
jgi:tetratricopeptide (TPR) repeat protein